MTAMDILTILNNAGQANKAFIVTDFKNYEYIGKKVTDDFYMFHPNKEEHTFPFTLVTNDKEANVSVRNMIRGKVTLNPKQAKKVNLPNEIECVQFKSYTIIKDGKIHTPKFTVRVDKDVLENLTAINSPIVKTVMEPNKLPAITFDLTGLEVADNRITDEELVELVQELNNLKVQEKVIKAINPNKEGAEDTYTDEQREFLAEYGIVNGVYNYIAPKEETENLSTYKVTEVLYQIKGAATIPSVTAAFKAKTKNGINQQIVDTYNNYANLPHDTLVKMQQEIKTKILNNKITLQNTRVAYVNNNGETRTIDNNGVVLNIKVTEREKTYTAG